MARCHYFQAAGAVCTVRAALLLVGTSGWLCLLSISSLHILTVTSHIMWLSDKQSETANRLAFCLPGFRKEVTATVEKQLCSTERGGEWRREWSATYCPLSRHPCGAWDHGLGSVGPGHVPGLRSRVKSLAMFQPTASRLRESRADGRGHQ